MNSLQESAWLAGLMEGEGSFGVRDGGPHRGARRGLIAKLKMTDKDVVEKAKEIMPACGPYVHNDNRPKHSTTYEVQWYGQRAENLMTRILPYMGERRKAKIDKCLSAPNLSHHSRPASA